MIHERRSFLKTGGLAIAAGAFLNRYDQIAADQPAGASVQMLGPAKPLQPEPARFDRLPLEWHQRTTRRLQEKLGARDLAGAYLRDRWNIIYFTGLWHTTTERPFHCYIGAGAEAPHWFYPGLDRDLVRSWWFGDGKMYFDFLHGEGAFPHEGVVQQGQTVNLFEYFCDDLKRLGLQGKRIGLDGELSSKDAETARRVLPGSEWINIGELCLEMRMVKDEQELALWSRAYRYFDRVHAFARDYLIANLGRGDLTDYEIGMAAEKYGNDLIMAEIRRDGRPHTAVGTGVGVGVRVGIGTAYPHPNQFHHNKVTTGTALQVAGGLRVGGYGGELYRMYLLGKVSDHMRKVWTVSRDCCLMQERESRHGVACSTVAYAIHKHQVDNGMAKYIYHRPAHGEGSEGHQAPYLALGDYTMLEDGMTFSVEPGLYDPEGGFGCNWSDTCLIRKESGVLMSRVPYTEDWCWLA
ncbi:MAG TPA: M24 family metallopeptidase [Acidobacteriota bacterium]